jgi:hypothetical protein
MRVPPVQFVARSVEWHPQFGIVYRSELELQREDPNNRILSPVQVKRLPDKARIAAEPPLPHAVVQNNHPRRTGPILVRIECTPQQGIDTEQRKQIGRHSDRLHSLFVVTKAKSYIPSIVAGYFFEDLTVFLQVKVVRV